MRINHKYDIYGRTEPSIIYLAKPGKRMYCALDGIDTSTVSLSLKTNNTAELTFTVDKYVDNTIANGYDELDELMELYCDGIWFKIVDPPSITNDGLRETKEITAESYEIMLTQYKLKDFKINMGEEDSYEMMYQSTHDTSRFYQIKFYDPDNEDLSLLHLVLTHADVPGWKIGYVDNITPDDDGMLLPNNICNFEVDDENVYAFLTQEAAQAYKCVFEFDTVNMTINAYRPGSLGKDTNVVLGFRNIQNNINISRDDNLVTQFYVEGLDDYNIDSVNFGDSVITDLSYFVREPYMNATLQEKYNAWQDYRESRREEFMNLSREYNENLEVLTELTNRVPVDSAQTTWFGQDVEDLKDAYDSNMAIIKGLESIYVDDEKNLDLDALKESSDWPLYESIMNYTLPSIVAALQAQDEEVDGYGKGNIISCVNPVVLGQDWYTVGSGTSSFQTVQIDNAPAYGITRGVQITGSDGGIYQHNISVEPSQRYTLSCFVKGTGTFYLGYNNTGEDRTTVAFGLSSSWARVYTSFNLSSRLIDVAFIGSSNFTVCGMQLEMGDSPSQFGYFTQSESIMKAYETDWKLYGIAELKTKISTYEACIKELKKNGYADGYNPLAGYEEAYFTQMHQKYLDYLNLKEQAEVALAERQAEYNAAERPEIQEKRNQIAKEVLMENFGKVQDKYSAFTDKEIYIIKSLYNQSTYTNENIIVTSLDSTADAVDKSKVLYDDAVEELYVESHPQYTYTDDIENIYALPEFKEYHEQLAVNDFVRVGLTDTDYIKLRVIEIIYNPCDLDESMEVTFSNVIQYKAKRNDYNSLLNDALNTSDRNGGRVSSVNKSSTSDYVISADVIKQIFSNPLFNSMLGGTTTGGAGSGGTITAEMIVAELVKAKEGVFDKLTVDTAFMKYLDVKLISADTITTRILEAKQANIEELSAKIIESNEIYADMIDVKKIFAGNAGVGNLTAFNITADNVTIDEATVKELIAKKITVGDLATQTAEARQIVLISKDDKPGIAFKDSTQQFYDSDGNVRVQIGQDGNGDFNFIVRGEDGSTALFDSKGIKRDGIPESTIINEMIEAGTVSKDRLNFKINTNEQGGIDITEIYDGEGGKWGEQYTSFKASTTEQIKNITDPEKGQIVTSISKAFFGEDGKTITDAYSMFTQTIDEIKTTISDNKVDADGKIEANTSSITQNADKIAFMVTGDKESEFEVTDKFIKMITDHISIDASTIDINGVITAMNNSIDSSTTRINGGIIDTTTVNAMLIAAQILQSKNYEDSSAVDGIYARSGLKINMETGAMTAKNFAIDDSGNAYFRGNGTFEGTITANEGHIGGTNGFTIKAGKLYSGMSSFSSDTTPGVYIGTDGIALGGGNFSVDSSGNLCARSGRFTGTIYADSGTIGGWSISGDSLTARNGWVAINPDYLKYGDNFYVDSSGKLTAEEATISGTIYATDGTFSGSLNGADGTFTGVLSAATGDFTGVVNATEGGNIGGFKVATSLDDSIHAYAYTLYTQATDDSGNTYQAGIKGAATGATSSATEAAFYIRKKTSSDSDWSESSIPFYVRKNGQMLCQDLTLGNSLYTLSEEDYDMGISSQRVKTIYMDGYGTRFGYLSGSNCTYIYTRAGDYDNGLLLFFVDGVQAFNMQRTASNGIAFTPGGSLLTYDLGVQGDSFSTLYVNEIVFDDNTSMTSAKASGSTSNYGSLTNKPAINGYTLVSGNNTLANLGVAASSHKHSNSDITWSTTLGYKGLGHCHTVIMNSNTNMCVAITNDDIPAFTPYNITSYTNINNYTVAKGGDCNLGDTSAPWNAVYAKAYYDENGNAISTGGSNISVSMDNKVNNGYGRLCVTSGSNTTYYNIGCKLSLYNSTLYLDNYSGSTVSSVDLSGLGGGSGTTYSAGSALYLSGTTFQIGYNSSYKIECKYGTSSSYNYVAFQPATNQTSSTTYRMYLGGYNSSDTSWHPWYRVAAVLSENVVSDKRFKTNICSINDKFYDAYMSLNPCSYVLKDDMENEVHYGFVAQEVESSFKSNGVNLDNHSIINIPKSGNGTYSLGYSEFIPFNTYMTQKAHHRIDSLEEQNTSLKSENQSLKNEVLMLQGQLSLITQRLEKLEEKLC